MRKFLMVGTGVLLLAGSGVALAQMPPGGPDGQRGPMGPHGGWMMHRHMGHDRGRGTAFRFRKGDGEVDIACSDHDSLQDCVTAATTLMDKISSTAPKPATP